MTISTGAKAGQLVYPDDNEILTHGVSGGVTIVAGNNITFDANGFIELADATSTRLDGFGVALEDGDNSGGADGDVEIQIAVGNTYVYAVAGAAIQPFKALEANATSRSIVQGTFDIAQMIGRYFGHQGEESNPTDAATDDVIIQRLGAD